MGSAALDCSCDRCKAIVVVSDSQCSLLCYYTDMGHSLLFCSLEPDGSDKWRNKLCTCICLHTPRCTIGAREELQLNEWSHFTTFRLKINSVTHFAQRRSHANRCSALDRALAPLGNSLRPASCCRAEHVLVSAVMQVPSPFVTAIVLCP